MYLDSGHGEEAYAGPEGWVRLGAWSPGGGYGGMSPLVDVVPASCPKSCSSAAVVFTMFQHLHGLLSSRQVFQLGLSDSPAGSVLRSGCSGTLAERVNALDAELAPHRETVLDGRVPALQFFRGDIHDVGKLAALKKLAEYLKEHGSILWNEAVGSIACPPEPFSEPSQRTTRCRPSAALAVVASR